MRASLLQIEAFYWAARLGSFHAAARHLHFTQPAISARIKELESALNLKLFERRERKVELTADGRNALVLAEKVLNAEQEFQSVGASRAPLRGLLRLGANESSALGCLPDILAQLKATYPDLKVELTIEVGAVLSSKLNARQLDIAFVTSPSSAPHVIDELVGWQDFRWVASPHMVLPGRDFSPADAAGLQIVTHSEPSTLHSVAKKWLRTGGFDLENFSSCNSLSLMLRLVYAGHAIATLPLSIMQDLIGAGAIRLLPADPPLPREPFFVSYLSDGRGPGIDTIVQMARTIMLQTGFVAPTPA
ncbi:LysR family transcriptional regulator [Paraburkholderia sp. RL17-337-BIB-A]|uniref:LysR family transcriptional regulator n=1 Tax=Paraburkholderia sp. RL17-337-BIB-A TaxID=3031636 RepID=UPI0038BA5E76